MGNKTYLLEDYLEIVTYGFTNPMPDADDGPWKVTAKDVIDGKINYSTARKTTLDAFENELTDKSRPKLGDVLLTKDGTLGRLAVVRDDNLCINQSVALLRPKASLLSEYLYYLLSSPKYQNEMIQNSDGSVIKHIYITRVGKMKVNIPDTSKQNKICSFLGGFDKKITLNRQINQTLEQMAQALFKSWFVDFDPVVDNALDAGFFEQNSDLPEELLRRAEQRKIVREQPNFKPLPAETRQLFPAAFEECEEQSLGLGGWVPKGWGYKPFGDLLDTTIGGDWGKDVEDHTHSTQARIVRGTDIPDLINGQLSSAPLRWVEPKKLTSRKIEVGDIIIEVSGGSPKQPTGRSILMTKNIIERLGGIIEPASFCRRFKPKSFDYGLLASLHLKKIYNDGKMWEYQNQSTGIANFQTKFFLEAESVILPSEQVLNAFSHVVQPWMDKSQSNEQIVLSNLRDTLLPKLISGELRLNDDGTLASGNTDC